MNNNRDTASGFSCTRNRDHGRERDHVRNGRPKRTEERTGPRGHTIRLTYREPEIRWLG